MTNPKHQLVQLFRDALDLEGEARIAFLDSECADPGMREELEALLLAAQNTAPKLPNMALSTLDGEGRSLVDRSGQIVGGFRLLKSIGQGGMGAVWLAERVGDFSQQVAIKWLHAGLSANARQRFARERETLAKLSHPGIARIVDGGRDGEADWFAMEYIAGVPLDQYATQNQCNLRRCIELIQEICEAVQFAHQNLVVHRDLKPGNILVGADGKAKLLDFGIAKLLDEPEHTQSRAPMTFAYAAPEQIKGDPISTATDVYALGVILFELLTGERPHKPKGDGSLSLLQAITDTDATAPSRVLSTRSRAEITQATPNLRMNRIWVKQVRGDLDTIVLKALAREPAQRYASAQALRDDLQRFLSLKPIQARNHSLGYRLAKFFRRNAVACIISATLLVLVISSTLSTYLASVREAHALRTAAVQSAANAQVSSFLISLFAAAAPEENLGKPLNAVEMLDIGWQKLPQQGAEAMQESNALIAKAIGESYMALGEFGKARAPFEYALERFAGQRSREAELMRADLQLQLVGCEAELVEFGQARQRLQALLPILPALNAPRLEVRALLKLGFIQRDTGDYSASAQSLRAGLRVADTTPNERANLWNSLGFTLALANDQAGSAQAFAQAGALLSTLDRAHPARLWLSYTHADALRRVGKWKESAALLGEVRDTIHHLPHVPARFIKVVDMADAALRLSQNQTLSQTLLRQSELIDLPNPPMNLPTIELQLLYASWLQKNGAAEQASARRSVVRDYCIRTFGAQHPYCQIGSVPN